MNQIHIGKRRSKLNAKTAAFSLFADWQELISAFKLTQQQKKINLFEMHYN